MASLISRLTDLATAIKTETKALRTMISGTNNGSTSGLATTATNLVGAVNEVRTIAMSAGTVTQTDINTAVANMKSEILGGAAAEVDTLVEIATLLATNTGTDAALAAVVANKANSSDVYAQAQIGNPDTNLVSIWNAA